MPTVKIGETGDLADGRIVPVALGEQQLLLTQVEGEIYALNRKCPHMGADLCGGRVVGGTIICPKHGAAFDIKTGAAVGPAKVLFLKMTPKPLATYPVTITGDDILVSID